MLGAPSLSIATPNTWPTWAAVIGWRCGSLIQWSPCGGRPGERTSMMLADVPSGLITVATPPCASTIAVPEKRVTTASPGCSGPCCAMAAEACKAMAAARSSRCRRQLRTPASSAGRRTRKRMDFSPVAEFQARPLRFQSEAEVGLSA
jgi:hypothetical protein